MHNAPEEINAQIMQSKMNTYSINKTYSEQRIQQLLNISESAVIKLDEQLENQMHQSIKDYYLIGLHLPSG